MTCFKNYLVTFVTKLVNAEEIMFQTFYQKNVLNAVWKRVTNIANSNNFSFSISSKSYFPSFFEL